MMDFEGGERHLPAIPRCIDAQDAAIGCRGDSGVAEETEGMSVTGLCSGVGDVKIAQAVALDVETDLRRGVSAHEGFALGEQAYFLSGLTVEIDAVLRTANLEEIAVERTVQVSGSRHQVEACMITSGRVEGAVHLHDPSGTVGSTEWRVETGTPGAEAVVEADSPVVRQTEFSSLSLP